MTPTTEAGRALRPMAWYRAEADGELLYCYVLSLADILAVEQEAAAAGRVIADDMTRQARADADRLAEALSGLLVTSREWLLSLIGQFDTGVPGSFDKEWALLDEASAALAAAEPGRCICGLPKHPGISCEHAEQAR